jgi:hypothetical protein
MKEMNTSGQNAKSAELDEKIKKSGEWIVSRE